MLQTVVNAANMAEMDIPSIEHLPGSLQTLILSLSQTRKLSPEAIKNYILDANISPDDLMPWADFSHPVTDSYGRKLVFHGGYFEIMVMSWLPGDYSAIHDHGGTQWGAVQCFGNADHYIYQCDRGFLSTLKPAHYSPGIIHQVDHRLIHQMGNPGNRPFLSLHVYGCGETRKNITGNARIFDLFEQTTQYTDGGVFFCLSEPLIKQRRQGLKGDPETTLRHHRQMSDRIQSILNAQESPTLQLKLSQLINTIQQLEGLRF